MFGLKFLAIMRRDLKKLTRNPITLISVILMPIVYLVIIGNSFQGQLKHLPIVVVEQDHGLYARRIVEQLLALQAGPKTVDVTFETDPGGAVDEVRNGLYKGVVVIPPDFSHDVAEGRIAQIGLFTDNVDSISSQTLEGVLDQAAATIKVAYVTAREPKLNDISLRPSWLFPYVDYDRSLIPGVIVMAIFMGSLMSGVFNWVMDKFMGVTECYLVTPLSRWDIAGGILASGVTVTSIGGDTGLVPGPDDHARANPRRPDGAVDADRNNHHQRDRPARDDILDARPRGPSAPGRNVLGISERDPVFPQRRDLSGREFPAVAANLRAFQSRDALGERNQTDPVQRRRLHRSKRRHRFLLVFMVLMLVLASVSFKRTL